MHAYLLDPEVRLFVPEWPETEAQAQEFVQRNLDDPRQYAVVLRSDGGLIGHMGFWKWFGTQTYEIGWAIAPAHQGCGYATEAAGAVLGHAFQTLGLHRVIAICDPANTALSV